MAHAFLNWNNRTPSFFWITTLHKNRRFYGVLMVIILPRDSP